MPSDVPFGNAAYRARVVRVIDGDTVDAVVDLGLCVHTAVRLRLARIDAFELRAKDPTEKAKAEAAKAHLEGLVSSSGWPLLVFLDKGTEKYGRWLAEIHRADSLPPEISVNDELLSAGLAKPYGGEKRT